MATETDDALDPMLKDSAEQLAGIFTKIFYQSLAFSTVPLCLTSSTIFLLPKYLTFIFCCPVALTLVVIKEKLVGKHIATLPLPGFDSPRVTACCDALFLLRKQGKCVQIRLCGSHNHSPLHCIEKVKDFGFLDFFLHF